MSLEEQRRERFEQAVIDRMKEGGFLEVEIRVECLVRQGEGYYDGSVDAYWHFWNAALDGVVIDLDDCDNPDDHSGGGSLDMTKTVEAIEAAGVQVKP